MNISTCIAIGMGIIASVIATFMLFAIAFNTPFSEIRLSFLPIYLGLIAVCLIASIIAQRRVIVIVISALFLPVLLLCYLASQTPEYFIDTALLVALCAVAATIASNVAQRVKKGSPWPK
jgi:hypothetical protein